MANQTNSGNFYIPNYRNSDPLTMVKCMVSWYFATEFCNTVTSEMLSCHDMVSTFNQDTKLVLDKTTSFKTEVLSDKSKSPCLRDELIRRKTTDCKNVEHKWRKTQLQEHFDIYRTLSFNYNPEIRKARQAYF